MPIKRSERAPMHASVISARARIDELAAAIDNPDIADWYLEEMAADFLVQARRMKWLLTNRGKRQEPSDDEVAFAGADFPDDPAPPVEATE